MKLHWPINHRAMIWHCAAVVMVTCAGARAEAQDWWLTTPKTNDRTRHFRLGPVVGLNMRANFKMNGEFPISGSGEPGTYDDGYVLVDETGNAGGYTWYWGYTNSTQFIAPHDDMNGTLTFHSASSFELNDSTSVDSAAQVGIDLVYGGKLIKSGDALVNWEFGFMWMPIYIEDDRQLSATFTRTTYVFDTGDIVVPSAPYNGGPSGPGPTIHADPTPGIPEITPGTITGSRALDVSLYNFRLGPSMHWEVNSWFAFSVGGGAAMGLTTAEYKYDETMRFGDGGKALNKNSFGSTDVMFGGYAGATLFFHTPEKADIFLSAQYMALGKVEVSSQGREASLDLGGQVYLSVGVNWSF